MKQRNRELKGIFFFIVALFAVFLLFPLVRLFIKSFWDGGLTGGFYQTVLLKGVNDRPDVLAELMNSLVACGIMPYYVFQCRPVEGVKNQFQVPFAEGVRIVDGAKSLMCGPAKAFRYVLSHPTGKIEVIGADSDGSMIFKYHQAKYDRDQSRIFRKKIAEDQCWLEENDTEGEQNADVSLCTETAKKIDDEALISLFFDIEKQGRRPSDQDRRTFHVSLTEEGFEPARKYDSDREKAHHIMVGRLSAEEKEKFYHLLSKIRRGYPKTQERMTSAEEEMWSSAKDKKE